MRAFEENVTEVTSNPFSLSDNNSQEARLAQASGLYGDVAGSIISEGAQSHQQEEQKEKRREAALRQQIETINKQLATIRAEISSLSARNDTVQRLLVKLDTEEVDLTQQQQALEENRPEVIAEIATAEAAEDDAQAAVEASQTLVEREQRAVIAAMDAKTSMRAEARLSREEETLSDRYDILELRQEAVLASKLDLNTLDKKLAKIEERLSEITTERAKLQLEQTQNTDRIAKLRAQEELLVEAQEKLSNDDFRVRVSNGEVTTEQALGELSPELRDLAKTEIRADVADDSWWNTFKGYLPDLGGILNQKFSAQTEVEGLTLDETPSPNGPFALASNPQTTVPQEITNQNTMTLSQPSYG